MGKKNSFTNQNIFIVTEEDIKRPWGGKTDGSNFRCGLCGHHFEVGDKARWVYTNSDKEGFGNPFVCEKCDGSNEDVIRRYSDLRKEFRSDKFWSFRKE